MLSRRPRTLSRSSASSCDSYRPSSRSSCTVGVGTGGSPPAAHNRQVAVAALLPSVAAWRGGQGPQQPPCLLQVPGLPQVQRGGLRQADRLDKGLAAQHNGLGNGSVDATQLPDDGQRPQGAHEGRDRRARQRVQRGMAPPGLQVDGWRTSVAIGARGGKASSEAGRTAGGKARPMKGAAGSRAVNCAYYSACAGSKGRCSERRGPYAVRRCAGACIGAPAAAPASMAAAWCTGRQWSACSARKQPTARPTCRRHQPPAAAECRCLRRLCLPACRPPPVLRL